MKTFQIASLLETLMMPCFILQCFKPQGPCQAKQITVPPAHASQGDAFIFSLFLLPATTDHHRDAVDCLTSRCARVCVSVCVCGSGQLATLSQWAITFVPVMYQTGIHSLFFFFFSLTHHVPTHTHTHKEDLTQSKCPDRPSQLDTPEQWCFPLAPMAWGIFHWLIAFTLLAALSLHQTSLAPSLFIHLCQAWSLTLAHRILFFFHSLFIGYHLHETCNQKEGTGLET